jgi:hypothetical protein
MCTLLRFFARRLRELEAATAVGRVDAALLFLLGCYWLVRERWRDAAGGRRREH